MEKESGPNTETRDTGRFRSQQDERELTKELEKEDPKR